MTAVTMMWCEGLGLSVTLGRGGGRSAKGRCLLETGDGPIGWWVNTTIVNFCVELCSLKQMDT
jgi:hypothetical protein